MIILLVNCTDYFIIKKEVVSPKSSTMMGKTIGQPADSGDELKPEIVQGTKEAPNSNKKALDGSIVGSRIKVRWPADEMFYNGLVKSFDASSETHEIVYDHGDVVRQSLKDEKWEFIAEEQDYNPDASPDMLEDRSDEGSLGQPFQDVHKAASSHSFVIQEKYNTVLNEIGCISTETTGSLLVRVSGWENCHLEPEKVSTVYTGQLPSATAHNLFAEKPQSFSCKLQHTSL
jgi:hypothetical protein